MKNMKCRFGFLLSKGFPQYNGTVRGLPLEDTVEILRDSWGIPHIYAANEHDLMTAQGFVHAQDRLVQLETIRRITAGNLAEIAGEETLDMDHFSRIAGFSTLRERAIRALSPENRDLLEAYASGINAYLSHVGKNLPSNEPDHYTQGRADAGLC